MKYHLELDIDLKRNLYRGTFIVVEGIDAAGKTTQVKDVTRTLSKNHRVFQTKNPTDGPIGKFIRKVLAGKIRIPSVAFQYLFSADREAQQEEVTNHLKRGDIVVMDRYIWSALAYGMLDRGFHDLDKTGNFLLVALSILSMYHQFILPDLTVYLDVSSETAVKRLRKVDKKVKELYETEEKIPKVKKCYEWLIKQFPNEIVKADGERPEAKVTQNILAHIEPLLKK